MTGPRFLVFDPLRDEYAATVVSTSPMTSEPCQAAVFASKAAAIMRGRELIGMARPWLVVQPVCPVCGGAA